MIGRHKRFWGTAATARAGRRGDRNAFRPTVLALEERELLSTIQWSQQVGGDFSVPGNWIGNRVPGPGDVAVIPFNNLTVTYTASTDTSVSNVTYNGTGDIFSVQGPGAFTVQTATLAELDVVGNGLFTVNNSG